MLTTQLFLAASYFGSVFSLYFTRPVENQVWETTVNETLEWTFQRGNPTVGTLVLQPLDSSNQVVLSQHLNLTTESLKWPSNITLASDNQQYFIRVLSVNDPSAVFYSVGPFTIRSFETSFIPSSEATMLLTIQTSMPSNETLDFPTSSTETLNTVTSSISTLNNTVTGEPSNQRESVALVATATPQVTGQSSMAESDNLMLTRMALWICLLCCFCFM